MATQADYDALKKENARLASQTRRLQELVGAMREEIADANAEIAASKRLYEEQKQTFLRELQKERGQKERLAQAIDARNRIVKKSVATMTFSEMSTSTVSDAATNTVISTIGDKAAQNSALMAATAAPSSAVAIRGPKTGTMSTGVGPSSPPPQPQYNTYRQASNNDMAIPPPPGFGASPNNNYNQHPHHHHHGSASAYPQNTPPHHHHQHPQHYAGVNTSYHQQPHGRASNLHENTELRQFADFLSRKSGYRGNRDLYVLFDNIMGASSVTELCATISEKDLVDFGIPLAKARSIMHLVASHTEVLLGGGGGGGSDSYY